jgi:glycerophosphoryl diester phosphodiesterase
MRYCSKIFYLLFVLVLVASCHKDPAIDATSNLNGNTISAFGHAGMGLGFKYPIDTYQSIEPCLRIGSDGSEMDIQMTKDSVLVVYHHKYLEEGTLCEGTINDKLWSEIWGCHHTSPISSKINLTSFSDLMDDLNAAGYNIHNYTFTFDCKLYTHTTDANAFLNQYANAILKVMDDFQLQNNLLIETQDTTFLRILQNKRNDLRLFIYPADFESGFKIAKSMNLYGITIHTDYITEAQVKLAHENGIRITLWGINSESRNVDAVLKNPDFIQTDKIIHLLKIFGKYKGNING